MANHPGMAATTHQEKLNDTQRERLAEEMSLLSEWDAIQLLSTLADKFNWELQLKAMGGMKYYRHKEKKVERRLRDK